MGVQVSESVVFGNGGLGLIAGPCAIESRDHCLRMAEAVSAAAETCGLAYVFKASFDKANRTAVDSARGPGIEAGLKILAEVRSEVGVPVLTDVHTVEQVGAAAEVCDVLQIPAFLCRQTDLVLAAAASGRVVNLKKGQFLAPWDMRNVVEKAASTGNERLLITERGASFGYNNLVVDFKGLGFMQDFGYPVVLDVTHSLQLPSLGRETGGERRFAALLARAGVAAGVDVLFIEVHDEPERAVSDATTQLPLAELDFLLASLRRVHDAVQADGARRSS